MKETVMLRRNRLFVLLLLLGAVSIPTVLHAQ
jgi:hypothetical protein